MARTILEVLRSKAFILTEGAVVERLRREPGGRLDPHVANAALLYDPEGRTALERIYREYLAAAAASGAPLLLLTPTWRANPERLRQAGLGNQPVQADAFRFLDGLRRTASTPVFIGGLMGCRGDAYDPREALDEKEAEAFHRPQAEGLAKAGVSLLYGATLPALSEAIGLARAMARTGLPYILGFPMRSNGTLLDGRTLDEAVDRLDGAADPPALGYMGHCVHSSVFGEAMGAAYWETDPEAGRWIGIQANASPLPPEELDGADRLHADAPETLADGIAATARRWGLHIVGGCCGTDARLTAALGIRLTGG